MMDMHIYENVSLKLHSTMRLGGNARYMCTIRNEADLLEALDFAEKKDIPFRVIGSGSNIIWKDEGFLGLIILNRITHHSIVNDTTICFGAGLPWDEAVELSVKKELSGLECLSLIPGTVGATPVQNVGAYGYEIRDTLVSLRAYDTQNSTFTDILNSECGFGYRTSRFKTSDSGRYIICSVTFELSLDPPKQPFYEALQNYLDTNNITEYTSRTLREAVVAIRKSKLPNPANIANNGSFFANPIVSKEQYEQLATSYPHIKGWRLEDSSYKLAAGWLIENAGFKDYHDAETGMSTWHAQNLVLVNEHATSTKQLLDFKEKIVSKVYKEYGVILEQEPELLP